MQCCCIAYCIVPYIATVLWVYRVLLCVLTVNVSVQLAAFLSSFFPWQGQSEWGKGTKWVSRLGGAPPNTVRSVRGLVGSRLASSRLTARDGRGLTARGHMARELTPSDGSWAHSSSICGDVCTLLSFLFVTNRNT